MLKHLFQPLLDWYQNALETGGYWVVGLLMTCESSVLPLPSESIIPLAASWSHAGKIHIGMPGIVDRGRARLVAGRDDGVLAGAAGGPAAADALWPLHFDHAGKNPEELKTGCRITARRACSSRGCCRARGSSSAFPPASRGWII